VGTRSKLNAPSVRKMPKAAETTKRQLALQGHEMGAWKWIAKSLVWESYCIKCHKRIRLYASGHLLDIVSECKGGSVAQQT
jgi:hypothetical protein